MSHTSTHPSRAPDANTCGSSGCVHTWRARATARCERHAPRTSKQREKEGRHGTHRFHRARVAAAGLQLDVGPHVPQATRLVARRGHHPARARAPRHVEDRVVVRAPTHALARACGGRAQRSEAAHDAGRREPRSRPDWESLLFDVSISDTLPSSSATAAQLRLFGSGQNLTANGGVPAPSSLQKWCASRALSLTNTWISAAGDTARARHAREEAER